MRRSDSTTAGPQPDDVDLTVAGDAPRGQVLVAGDLDMLIAPRLEVLLDELLSAGYRQLSVDLSGVGFVAAAGLNVLCRATRRYHEAAGRLHLVALSRPVRRVLIISGLVRCADRHEVVLPVVAALGAAPHHEQGGHPDTAPRKVDGEVRSAHPGA